MFDPYVSPWLALLRSSRFCPGSLTDQFATPFLNPWHFLTPSLLYFTHHLQYYLFAFCLSPFTRRWGPCGWRFSSVIPYCFPRAKTITEEALHKRLLNDCTLIARWPESSHFREIGNYFPLVHFTVTESLRHGLSGCPHATLSQGCLRYTRKRKVVVHSELLMFGNMFVFTIWDKLCRRNTPEEPGIETQDLLSLLRDSLCGLK